MAIYDKRVTGGNGINYTKEVDGSGDYPGLSSSTYFKDLSDGLIRYKDSNGVILEMFTAGSSDTNIANTDLTFTTNRIHNLDVNTLTFNSTASSTSFILNKSGTSGYALQTTVVSGQVGSGGILISSNDSPFAFTFNSKNGNIISSGHYGGNTQDTVTIGNGTGTKARPFNVLGGQWGDGSLGSGRYVNAQFALGTDGVELGFNSTNGGGVIWGKGKNIEIDALNLGIGVQSQNILQKLHVGGNIHVSGYTNYLEIASASTPSSGLITLYAKTDGQLWYKNDTGNEYTLGNNIATTDLTLPIGTRNLSFGGPSVTDVFAFRNSINNGNLMSIHGDNKVIIGSKDTTPSGLLYLRHDFGVASDVLTIRNGQYGNLIFRITDNRTSNTLDVGTARLNAILYGGESGTTRAFDLGGYGLGTSHGDYLTNAVWMNNQGNIGDGQGSSVIAVNSNFYINLSTTKKFKFDAVNTNFGVGAMSFGTNATNTFGIINGSSPTSSITNGFQQYSADIVDGNAAPHFRTESGDVIKLYKYVNAALANTANTGDANTDALIEALKTLVTTLGLGSSI